MKSVLISIQPKYVELIASGEKTIEVRKTRPKIDTPFKCYIYCTKGEQLFNNTSKITKSGVFNTVFDNHIENINDKAIGEFVCDRINEFHAYELEPSKSFYDIEKARLDLFLKESCLSYNEVCNYRKNLPYFKPLYGWHISNLVIYDKPKELSEFRLPCNYKGICFSCARATFDNTGSLICKSKLTRPPQSWCYVEEKQYERN